MLDLINTPPHKIVFLGPGCSIATKPIAEAASYLQAVQVSVRNKSNKIISKKNQKQEANKTNNKNNENKWAVQKRKQQQQKNQNTTKEESVCFFRILLKSEHQPEAARSFLFFQW